jgi:copper homeostasis protein CutC
MKNEKGVVYPLVMTLCFILVLFFGYLTEQVFNERQFVTRQEEQFREVRLIQQAAKKVKILAGKSVSYPDIHHFSWKDGEVDIVIYQSSETERMVLITAITQQQHTKKVKLYYNVNLNRVTDWVEG